jgi:hypothetical protein
MIENLLAPDTATPLRAVSEDPDYCQCGRGVVIGLLSYTNSRVLFRTADEGTVTRDQAAADLRCLDCVADVIAEVASGEAARRMREIAQSRRGVA